jgi:sulfite oxidase
MKQVTDESHDVQSGNLLWGKRRDMTVRGQSPFNAEPPASVLAGGEVTALDAFYSRNHVRFPTLRPSSGA